MLSINDCVFNAYQNSLKHGFWGGLEVSNTTVVLSKLMLIVTEIAEAAEVVRKSQFDDKTVFDHLAEELADTCIRVFDLAGAVGVNLEESIEKKMAYNEDRPFKHGKLA